MEAPIKTNKRVLTATERRSQAVALRIAGATLEQIARQLDMSTSGAHKTIQAALRDKAAATTEQADTLRQIEIERLDMAILAIVTQVKAGHLGAIDRWIKLSESRRKLLGLDAPMKASNQNWDMSIFSDEELARIAEGVDPSVVVQERKL